MSGRSHAWMLGLLLIPGAPADAEVCPAPAAEVAELLERGDAEAAEARALELRDAAADRPEGHEALAAFYLRWAARSADAGETLDRARASRALGALQEVADRWPERTAARLCRATVYRRLGMRAAYLDALDEAARGVRARGGADLDAVLAVPAADLEAGRVQLGSDAYGRLAAVFPRSPIVLSNRAAALVQLGELEAAERSLARARELAPDDPLILRNAATVAIYLLDLDGAVDALARYAAQRPEHVRVLFELAAVELGRDPRQSLPAWERYLERHAARPDDEVWARLAAELRDRLGKQMGEPELLAVARALMDLGAPRYAIPLLGGLTRRVDEEPMYPFVLALAYERCGVAATARRLLERAQSLLEGRGETAYGLSPSEVRYELGRVALELGDLDASLEALEAVERADPSTRNLQYLLAVLHARRGDPARARAYFARCAEDPNNADYREVCRSRSGAP